MHSLYGWFNRFWILMQLMHSKKWNNHASTNQVYNGCIIWKMCHMCGLHFWKFVSHVWTIFLKTCFTCILISCWLRFIDISLSKRLIGHSGWDLNQLFCYPKGWSVVDSTVGSIIRSYAKTMAPKCHYENLIPLSFFFIILNDSGGKIYHVKNEQDIFALALQYCTSCLNLSLC